MCGIAGFVQPSISPTEAARRLQEMVDDLEHRGPDSAGHWYQHELGLAMGHRRLAIRDLSPAGHQPMISPTGRFVMTYNGEIYNPSELRAMLPRNLRLRGTSDTELLLAGFEHLGVNATLGKVAGMFAIALYSRDDRKLTLIRDRLGIKPLFYSTTNNALCWASEPRVLLAGQMVSRSVEPESLALFLRFGYVPGNGSILEGVSRIPPGTTLTFEVQDPSRRSATVYWSAVERADMGRHSPVQGDEVEIIEGFEHQLRNVVAQHMISDVPLGTFLSGGIDSSLILSLMQVQSSERVRSFSIGFDEPRFDEAPYARQIANHIGSQHEEYYLPMADVANTVPRLPELYSEPLSDTSAIPTLCLARLTRKSVTVALSGDGGDELFVGYKRYAVCPRIYRRANNLPFPLRRMIRGLLSIPSASFYNHFDPLKNILARRRVVDSLAESVRKFNTMLAADSFRQLYECISAISCDANRSRIVLNSIVPDLPLSRELWSDQRDMISNMQLWDIMYYLPNDILHKVDIATMAVGLEARVPLLDHRIYEWAWKLPANLKRRGEDGKHVLQRILAKHVPERMFRRDKKGFSAPLSTWLRGPLRDWSEALLDKPTVERSGLLDYQIVRRYRDEFTSGRTSHARLWPILVFLAWYEHHISPYKHAHEHRLRHASRHSVSVGR